MACTKNLVHAIIAICVSFPHRAFTQIVQKVENFKYEVKRYTESKTFAIVYSLGIITTPTFFFPSIFTIIGCSK